MKNETEYLNNLLYPEKNKGVKIPSLISTASCSFQLHNSISLKTNNKGNFVLFCNPFYLANKECLPIDTGFPYVEESSSSIQNESITNSSTLWFDNSNTLDGNSSNDAWEALNIGQDIPNLYEQYRLVSACITLKYIWKIEQSSGIIGGGIVFDQISRVGGIVDLKIDNEKTTTWDAPVLSKYGNFDLIRDTFSYKENLCIDGLRALYYPIDTSYENYIKVNDFKNIKLRKNIIGPLVPGIDTRFQLPSILTSEDYCKTGFNWLIYVSGAPANVECFKCDIFCNFECLPNSTYMNYMPLSSNNSYINNNKKYEIYSLIQKQLFL